MKKAILLLFIGYLTILYFPAYAVHSEPNKFITENKNIEQQLGRKLSLKEKIGLAVLRKTLKKTKKKKNRIEKCAKILLKSGKIIKVEIQNITATEVTYIKCGQSEQEPISISIDKITEIRSSKGFLVYESKNKTTPIDEKIIVSKNRKTDVFAILSFVFSLTVFLTVLGFIFGLISLKRMRKHPEKYKGKVFAIIGTVIGGLYVLFILVTFLLTFLLLL